MRRRCSEEQGDRTGNLQLVLGERIPGRHRSQTREGRGLNPSWTSFTRRGGARCRHTRGTRPNRGFTTQNTSWQRAAEERSNHGIRRLTGNMEAWEQAERIRRYTNALVEKAAGQGPILPESDLAKWIAWAGSYADRIDPLAGKITATPQEFWE